ncbi:hypothetical protein [Rheinheimera sp. 1928-s]|uniref:hypothetical protein n=1 Tax=Rheinheimera sp. 1928-s TaxID=3033803 RepID=UPI002602C334|nr:hypothetical protein [Rheinheimera sp. 1928-s]MDF3125081.1 hypothetical protein [Rheinheimera sp. 1928-s]
MLEWILIVLGVIIAGCFLLLDGFNAYNLIQFFRGKKTPVEHSIVQHEKRNADKKH